MRHALATAALAVIALGAWWCIRGGNASPRADEAGQDGRLSTHASATHASDGRLTATSALGDGGVENPSGALPLARSLRGTDIDGRLTVLDGIFVPDRFAVRLFDYFLSAEGELSAAEIRRLVEAAAREQVPPDQVDEVMALFDRYTRFRQRAHRLPRGYTAAAMGDYLTAIEELQVNMFGAEDAAQMFGRQNALARDSIARNTLYQDSSLGWEEKTAELAALDAKLPEPIREARRQREKPREVAAIVAQMREDGVDEEEIHAYRADEFGKEAAQRLADLDAKRAKWTGRLDDYRKERDAILSEDLEPRIEEEQIEQLRRARFEGAEVTRVRVLDKMDAAKNDAQ